MLNAYGWPAATTVADLQRGENDTFLVAPPGGRCVVRRYREGRFEAGQIRGELSWLAALEPLVAVPRVIPAAAGDLLVEAGGRHYAAFAYVDGAVAAEPGPDEYRMLGKTLRALHEAADAVARQAAPGWAGWTRPFYTPETLVDEPLAHLCEAPWLTEPEKDRAVRLAAVLRPLAAGLEKRFVHNDLHLGNVLITPEGPVCLDFDECGFGPRTLDLGVPRMHLRSQGRLADCWPAFLAGYGPVYSDREIALGTALRVFYMAGKIPLRLDIIPDPAVKIGKYLSWIEAELDASGSQE